MKKGINKILQNVKALDLKINQELLADILTQVSEIKEKIEMFNQFLKI